MQSVNRSRVIRTALVFTSSGCLAVVALLVLIGGALTPDYRHMSQFISELGATGAPLESWIRFGGFLPAGVLLLTFCALAFEALPRSPRISLGLIGLAVYAAGYLVATFFPCDPGCQPPEPSLSQIIHNAGGLAGYLLAPAFLFVLANAAKSWPRAAGLVIGGYVASAVALVSLLTLTPSSSFAGLSQRVLEISVLGWVAMFGIYLATRDSVAVNLDS